MKTANRTKPKTDFGIEVRVFTAQTGMTVKELAERAGVKYTTLVETTTGRCAGHQLIPVVREFMQNYRKEVLFLGRHHEDHGLFPEQELQDHQADEQGTGGTRQADV